MKSAFQLIFLFCCAYSASAKGQIPRDSIRTEMYKNHQVIIYRVSSKETIYSISRKYSVSPKEVILLNEGHQSLRVGDEIRIPYKPGNNPETRKNAASVAPAEQSYTVEKKETLYSIARKFGMQPKELEKINALTNTVLKPGQLLTVIPYKKYSASAASAVKPAIDEKTDENKETPSTGVTAVKPAPADKKPNIPATGLYIVQAGETVFSISSRYGIPVARIDELNHLQNNGIHTGQTIKLNAGAAEPLSKANPVDEVEEKAPEQHKPAQPIIHQQTVDTPKPIVRQPEIILPGVDQQNNSSHASKEYKEEGLGLWLNNNDLNQARSVGLHRTAPVGTIVKVTNPMSRKSIFIKVVGSFPVNAESKDALIIISKSAAELIGALDQRFRVELSYAY